MMPVGAFVAAVVAKFNFLAQFFVVKVGVRVVEILFRFLLHNGNLFAVTMTNSIAIRVFIESSSLVQIIRGRRETVFRLFR